MREGVIIVGIYPFGLTVHSVRQSTGLGVRKMARKIGVSKGTVQNWEHGRSLPTQRNLIKLTAEIEMDESDYQELMDNYVTDEIILRPERKSGELIKWSEIVKKSEKNKDNFASETKEKDMEALRDKRLKAIMGLKI